MLHAQAAAYRVLQSEAPHAAIADHAGSGKTLAYLAPLVQALRGEEVCIPYLKHYVMQLHAM